MRLPLTWDRLLAAALPVVAVVALIVVVLAAVVSSASAGTLGYDFLAYDIAVRRALGGGSLYDPSLLFMGPSGLYFYPPPFVLLAMPIALLNPAIAAWAWTLTLFAAFVSGVALLPVDRRIRWAILLLGAISWPLVYAIKLGQVGPILFLTFAVGWRWIDRPWRLGGAIAIGTAIKLQPALLFAWALVTGRRRAVVAGLVLLGILALLATMVAGPSAWLDQATLLARVSRPIDTPHNFTPGAIAFAYGAPEALAWAIQIANWVLVGVILVIATMRCRPAASYLAVVVASQLASPVLWDHYALILLLPVARLLSVGQRWAVLIPLSTSVLLLDLTPAIAYPIAFWVALIAVVREGWRPTGALRAARPWASQPPPH